MLAAARSSSGSGPESEGLKIQELLSVLAHRQLVLSERPNALDQGGARCQRGAKGRRAGFRDVGGRAIEVSRCRALR